MIRPLSGGDRSAKLVRTRLRGVQRPVDFGGVAVPPERGELVVQLAAGEHGHVARRPETARPLAVVLTDQPPLDEIPKGRGTEDVAIGDAMARTRDGGSNDMGGGAQGKCVGKHVRLYHTSFAVQRNPRFAEIAPAAEKRRRPRRRSGVDQASGVEERGAA